MVGKVTKAVNYSPGCFPSSLAVAQPRGHSNIGSIRILNTPWCVKNAKLPAKLAFVPYPWASSSRHLYWFKGTFQESPSYPRVIQHGNGKSTLNGNMICQKKPPRFAVMRTLIGSQTFTRSIAMFELSSEAILV